MRRARAGIEAKWRERLAAMDASGLKARAFALREGLTVSSVYAWQRRLRADGSLKLVPVLVRESRSPALSSKPMALELVIDERVTIRVPSDFDAAALTRLLAVVVR
jgi:transposase